MNRLGSDTWSEGYTLAMPLQVPLASGAELACEEVVRAMPGRRYVCRARLDGKPVFVKLFAMTRRGGEEYKAEQQGIAALQAAAIAAPRILYFEEAPALETRIVVFEALANAESARQRWEQGDAATRTDLLEQLVALVAKHHAAGIRQADLHLMNFVFSEGVLYTLDAADIQAGDHPLSRNSSMDGLADLLALFPVDYDHLLPGLYVLYWQTRGGETDPAEQQQLASLVAKLRRRKLNKYLDKSFRDCSAFAARRSWQWFSVYVREEDGDDLQALLAEPDTGNAAIHRTIIKNGNTCTVSLVETATRRLVCKRYNIKHAWHGLLRAFRPSRASCSWRNALRLQKYGIRTPRPLALVEKRFGPLRREAWLFMEAIDGTNAYDFFRDESVTAPQRDAIIDQFVALFERLVAEQVSHGDMKITNFIVSDGQLVVIDLDAMQAHGKPGNFAAAFRRDLQRFMRNWAELPELAAAFRTRLATTTVARYLPGE